MQLCRVSCMVCSTSIGPVSMQQMTCTKGGSLLFCCITVPVRAAYCGVCMQGQLDAWSRTGLGSLARQTWSMVPEL